MYKTLFLERFGEIEMQFSPNVIDYCVRSDVANRNYGAAITIGISQECITELSNHCNSIVRAAVAMNPRCSKDLLFRLWNDDDEYVIQCVTRNPNFAQYFSN